MKRGNKDNLEYVAHCVIVGVSRKMKQQRRAVLGKSNFRGDVAFQCGVSDREAEKGTSG